MKKILIAYVIYSFLEVFTKSQNTANGGLINGNNNPTNSTIAANVICEITKYGGDCHTDKRCAFVESQKGSYRYFACLEVAAKDCNFFCNYYNELNTSGGITSKDCVCNGIKYPQ